MKIFVLGLLLVASCDQRPDMKILSRDTKHYTWKEHEVHGFSMATQADCESIAEYEMRFPIFNPEGFQIHYARSRCFMALAIRTKNKSLCREVKEFKLPLWDGSKISPEQCLKEF